MLPSKRFSRSLFDLLEENPVVLPNLPRRAPTVIDRYRPSVAMDAYPGYRETSSARSPQERTWNSRDEYPRERENPRTDTFYRGRSPGMFRLDMLLPSSHL